MEVLEVCQDPCLVHIDKPLQDPSENSNRLIVNKFVTLSTACLVTMLNLHLPTQSIRAVNLPRFSEEKINMKSQTLFPSFYCECIPRIKGRNHYNIAFALIFRQCLYSNSDTISYILGLASLLTSMISLFPQIIKNFVWKSTSSLSIGLFIIWMVGDVSNLIGCLLTNQLATQLYLAIYYVTMDVIVISQYCYYEYLIKIWKRRQQLSVNENVPLVNEKTRLFSHPWPSLLILLVLVVMSHPNMVTEAMSLCNSQSDASNGEIEYIVGLVSSWISCMCYIVAYVPQILKNYKRKSVKGLSVSILTNNCQL